MQFKPFGDAVSISGPFKLMWNRISFSRLTIIYFCFSITHFVIQLSFQIKAFTINAEASKFLSNIVNDAQTTNNSLPILRGSTLRMCSWVPSNLDVDVSSCPIVWNGGGPQQQQNEIVVASTSASSSASITTSSSIPSTSSVASTSASTSSSVASSSTSAILSISVSASPTTTTVARQTQTVIVIVPQSSGVPNNTRTEVLGDGKDDDGDEEDEEGDVDEDNEKVNDFRLHNYKRDVQIIPDLTNHSVKLVGLPGQPNVVLDNGCLWALNWPVSILDNTKREDMVFIAFQVWVLGMSIVALLNESIPHILASLVTHLMATAWASFQISHTANFRADFNRVITHGACNNVVLLPNYWEARSRAELPSLILNVVALFISCFLTWKLIKLFGWQTFKRVGASLTINRIYKLVLILSITIQLSLFFMIVTVSLWVDQLMNSVIGDLASFLKLYKITSFITLALLIPWLMTGWFAVRRELRVPMIIFLALSVLYLAGWGIMFVSTTFRWTFTTWTFFSIMACASVFMTFLSAVLGVVCRLNFGKGLARYLNAQQPLEDDYLVTPYDADAEKVAFPSAEKPLPTYSSYDDYESGVPYTYSTYSGSTLGPRFSNKSAEPFEANLPGYPAPVLQRNVTDLNLVRTNSYGSTRSGSSRNSGSSKQSHSRTDSNNSYGNHRRWVIE